jgi:hypothetical protein
LDGIGTSGLVAVRLRVGRWQPSGLFASRLPATFETVTIDRRIHGAATSDIYANRV